ncbi:SSU ribosomal protein S14p (S29e) [Bifidobacterium breve]|nr:SSU ribosomal protein S14p (S29e) [Bifidobacterium breve]
MHLYRRVARAHPRCRRKSRAAGGNPAPRRRQRGIPPFSADEEHAEAMRKLQALPHDASPTVCATAIPSTAVRAPTTASSACHVSICVRRHTRASCPAW